MKISLKDINKIREGSISLNGLTVIAGVNDSGKSTVGKMLFALIKAINNAKHYNDKEMKRSWYRLERYGGTDSSAIVVPIGVI